MKTIRPATSPLFGSQDWADAEQRHIWERYLDDSPIVGHNAEWDKSRLSIPDDATPDEEDLEEGCVGWSPAAAKEAAVAFKLPVSASAVSTINPRPVSIPSTISDLTPDFRMGIEFEGLVRNEVYDQFVEAMEDLSRNPDGTSVISFGDDESIKDPAPGFVAVEIRTMVLRSSVAVSLLERMLCFLYLASQTDDWRTTPCCGLHINISEKTLFKGQQVDFYCHVLRHFDEQAVLDTFGRQGNKYCQPFFTKTGAARELDSIKHQYQLCKRRERDARDRGETTNQKIRESKYYTVALRDSPIHDDYDGEQITNQRVEFRAIGNKDYHLRFGDLDVHINHMIDCVKAAYRETKK